MEKVTKENLAEALSVQHEAFPNEHGDRGIVPAVKGKFNEWIKHEEYWLGRLPDGSPVGIVGLYIYHDYPKDAWIDWLGVLPIYQGKGYGTQLFEFAKNEAKRQGFENLRLYADDEDNRIGINIYKKQGMQSEIYSNKDDPFYQTSNTIICSLGLTGKKAPKWNNRKLYQKEYFDRVLPWRTES
jgi:ribosomal protein S18 acetylase RimI-like enzyme